MWFITYYSTVFFICNISCRTLWLDHCVSVFEITRDRHLLTSACIRSTDCGCSADKNKFWKVLWLQSLTPSKNAFVNWDKFKIVFNRDKNQLFINILTHGFWITTRQCTIAALLSVVGLKIDTITFLVSKLNLDRSSVVIITNKYYIKRGSWLLRSFF